MSEEFRVKDWLAEGLEGMKSQLQMPQYRLLPEEFGNHLRASRKEMLLAFRSLFDAAIEKVDREKPATRKASKIKVES